MEYGAAIMVLASVVMLGQGCTDLGPLRTGTELDEMKVYYSDAVVFGVVKGITPSETTGIKNVEFEVVCSYKGNVHTKTIYITGVGNRNGEMPGCPKVKVEKDEQVVFFLKRLPSRSSDPWFEAEFAPLRGDSSIFLDDMTVVCGLDLTTGGEVMEADVCFEPIGEEDCEMYYPPTTMKPRASTMKPKTTAAPTNPITKGPPVDEGSEPENDEGKTDDTKGSYATQTVKPKPSRGGAENSKTGTSTGEKGGSTRQAAVSLIAILLSLFVAILV